MTGEIALEATDLRVEFGGLVAVDGVSVAARYGQVSALIGPNGAGKTTTFNVCCGFLKPGGGRVVLDGRDITAAGPQQRARLGVGRTFQRMQLFRSMTVRENVALAAESKHMGRGPLSQLGLTARSPAVRTAIANKTDEVLERTGIAHLGGRLAGEISTGQGRVVELARAIAGEPRVLLLDEPSSGLDGGETEAFGQLLRQLVGELGAALLLVEHDMSLVLSISDHIDVMEFGRPLFSGSPAEVASSEAVRAAYLGRHATTPAAPTRSSKRPPRRSKEASHP